jgi:hypothetical protein
MLADFMLVAEQGEGWKDEKTNGEDPGVKTTPGAAEKKEKRDSSLRSE